MYGRSVSKGPQYTGWILTGLFKLVWREIDVILASDFGLRYSVRGGILSTELST